jgi:hypothetical protein
MQHLMIARMRTTDGAWDHRGRAYSTVAAAHAAGMALMAKDSTVITYDVIPVR